MVLAAGASKGVISIFGNYALSYNAQGLNAYDLGTGALADTAQLTGVKPGPYALNYGQSYANGYFFIAAADGSFSGFQIGLPPSGDRARELGTAGGRLCHDRYRAAAATRLLRGLNRLGKTF